MSIAIETQPTAGPGPSATGETLAGRTALVTGGNRGIGAAICRSLASEGANVAAGYSRNKDQAETLAGKLGQWGVEASAHRGDIGNPEDCRRVVAEVIEEHGQLD